MLKKIREDKFIKNNIVFFCGSMAVAFLNYLYHPALGRILTVADFGEVQAFLALTTQLAIIFSVFSLITVNISVNASSREECAAIIYRLKQIALGFVVLMFFSVVIFYSQLQELFKFTSVYSLPGLVFLLFLTALAVFRNAYLQGQSNFKAISVSGVLNSASRLLFSVGLIYLGLRVGGVIIALIIAQFLAYVYVFYKTKDDLKFVKTKVLAVMGKKRVKQELKYGLLIFLIIGASTLFFNSDILVVKKFFSPEVAGFYSGISVIAKIILFATGSITGVMLPTVKLNTAAGAKKTFFPKSLLILSLAGGGILLFFALFPHFVINLLLGGRYLVFASYLPKLGLVMFLFSIVNLFFYYFLALRRYSLIIIAGLGTFLLLTLTWLFHQSIDQIINNYLISALLITAYLLLYYFLYNLKSFFNKSSKR